MATIRQRLLAKRRARASVIKKKRKNAFKNKSRYA